MNIQTVFLSANILSLLRISPKLDPLGDERPKKTQKGHFMEAEWVPKTWKNFELDNHKCYTHETYHDFVSS